MSGTVAVACLLGIVAIAYGIPVPLLAATAVLVAGAAWRAGRTRQRDHDQRRLR